MSMTIGAYEISSRVKQELEGTQYACTSLKELTGGTCNFIFHGVLSEPLPNGTREVVIKHGEDYVASHQAFKLSTSRCKVEEVSLQALETLPAVSTEFCVVRTPRCFHFNVQTNTQVQEYLPDAVNLKTYALSQLSDNPHDLADRCYHIGRGLGAWLRNFHTWAALPAQAQLQSDIKLNEQMQMLKNHINYGSLILRIDMYPDILDNSDTRSVFEQVTKMSEAELADKNNLEIIHGDFWTGNVLIPNQPLRDCYAPSIFIIDWELCSYGVRPLDLGQMIAELYELYLFRGIEAGLWMMKSFWSGYGIDDESFAFRTAIHVGTHLICFGNVQGWGSQGQVLSVVAKGKEIILRAWNKDKDWFCGSELACLFN